MEKGEVYKVLTPEQKMEVRKRALALHQGAQKDLEKKKLPPHVIYKTRGAQDLGDFALR